MATAPKSLCGTCPSSAPVIRCRMNRSNPDNPAFPYYVADYVTMYYDTILSNVSLWDNTTLYGFVGLLSSARACSCLHSPSFHQGWNGGSTNAPNITFTR